MTVTGSSTRFRTPGAARLGAARGASRKMRVLLVAQEGASLAARLYESRGFDATVTHVRAVDQALNRLGAIAYDLVALAIDSGVDKSLMDLRRRAPGVPVVVVSDAPAEELEALAAEHAVDMVFSSEETSRPSFPATLRWICEAYRARSLTQQWRVLLDVDRDGVLVVNRSGDVRLVNEAACRFFGRSKEELGNEPLLLSSESGVDVELRAASSEGPRYGVMRLTDIEYDGEGCILVKIRDITDQKNLEVQLLAADRMTSVGTLVAGVAHEISNPLNCVCGNLELVIESLSELRPGRVPRGVMEELADAQHASERVRSIVRDLRVFSRRRSAELERVDPHSVIESTLRIASVEIRRRARLVCQYGDVPPVLADEGRLGQVILNLLLNAAQAIPAGNVARNEVRIETKLAGDGMVKLFISDTGSGMSDAVQKKVFTPFFTTKGVGEGTGLGLAISEQIVASFGGRIHFESEPGRGTRFCVSLPPFRHDTIPPPPPSERASQNVAKPRLLVVDDEKLILSLVARAASEAFEVVAVESGAQALALHRLGERFDLVLCDLTMPSMSGQEYYRSLRELGGDCRRVVFMTGTGYDPDLRVFLDSTESRCVGKPFTVQALRDVLRESREALEGLAAAPEESAAAPLEVDG